MSNTITVTVDLDKVREHAKRLASDNSGLETSSGIVPRELERAIEVIPRSDDTRPLLNLLYDLCEILRDVHDEHQ